MTELDRSWIRMPGQEIEHQPDPDGLFIEEYVNGALSVMTREARELGLNKGLAFLGVWPSYSNFPKITFTVVNTLERDPNPDDAQDMGTNYFGMAMNKLAYMLSTDENSGSLKRPLKKGEVDYKGGVIITTQEGTRVFGGYSGGTPDQDLQITLKGLRAFIELID